MPAVKEREPRTIQKQTDQAILYSDGTILIKEVRASYPHLFRPFEGEDDDGNKKARYGMTGLMPKTKKYLPAKDLIRDHVRELLKENKIKDLPADRKFLRDGDLAAKDEYEGMFTISAGEVRRPQLRDNVRDPKTKKPRILKNGEDEDRIYAGCWVNMLIRPWYQNHKKYGKRVNANLIAVMFVRDDEPFGQGRISEDEIDETFDEFADDDSGFDDALGEDDEL